MRVTDSAIHDVKIIEPQVFADERGFFYESFNLRRFVKAIGRECAFVQDNHALSSKGVLRGLHYQLPPKTQGKLVRVVRGEIFDVSVDLRKSSPTFGQWAGEYLGAENKRQLWIPEGFAHGYLTLSGQAELLYKTTDYYAPTLERCIVWNDETIGIQWPDVTAPILSEKDAAGVSLQDAHLLV